MNKQKRDAGGGFVVGVMTGAVVGAGLALLFALSAPWNGPLIVTGEPIDVVLRDLGVGFFAR